MGRGEKGKSKQDGHDDGHVLELGQRYLARGSIHGIPATSRIIIFAPVSIESAYIYQSEPDETALNCYKSGKRVNSETISTGGTKMRQKLQKLLYMAAAYESLLYVECVKYDKRDKQ